MFCEAICVIVKWMCYLSIAVYIVCMYGAIKGWF